MAQPRSWTRSLCGVSAAAVVGGLASLVFAGEFDLDVVVMFAAGAAGGFAVGDSAAVQQRSRVRRALIYYAAAALPMWLLFPLVASFAPVLLHAQPPPILVPLGGGAFVAAMIPLHYWLPRTDVWVAEPHVRLSRLLQWSMVVGGLCLLCGLAWFRVAGSAGLRLELLFLAPVVVVSWSTGRWGGLTVAVLASMVYVLTASRSGGEDLPAWGAVANNLIMVGALIPTALAVAALRRSLSAERENASRDPLTGLHNRRAFNDALDRELARVRRGGPPFTVASIDLDGFKGVNDSMGHAAGDAVLRAVANVLRVRLRQSDVAARLGGDEFAILLVDAPADAASRALHKLNEELRARMLASAWPVTFSIGAVSDIEGGLADDLLRQADDLMYAVKHAGKGDVRIEMGSTLLGRQPGK